VLPNYDVQVSVNGRRWNLNPKCLVPASDVEFFDEENALAEAEYVLAATPQEWKRLLRKEGKFVTDFMLGKVTLEHGSRVGVLGVAPHSGTLVDALTQVELQFPDEMSEDELEQYRSKMKAFRKELSV